MSRFLSLSLALLWLTISNGAIIYKEDLRGLPDEMYRQRLQSALDEIIRDVVFSAKMNKTILRREIYDSPRFMRPEPLKEFPDSMILSTLKETLVDCDLSITRDVCDSRGQTNCRILTVEW